MPIYFCDSLKDVSILNGVARLEFQRLEAAPGENPELRMVAEFTWRSRSRDSPRR